MTETNIKDKIFEEILEMEKVLKETNGAIRRLRRENRSLEEVQVK